MFILMHVWFFVDVFFMRLPPSSNPTISQLLLGTNQFSGGYCPTFLAFSVAAAFRVFVSENGTSARSPAHAGQLLDPYFIAQLRRVFSVVAAFLLGVHAFLPGFECGGCYKLWNPPRCWYLSTPITYLQKNVFHTCSSLIHACLSTSKLMAWPI